MKNPILSKLNLEQYLFQLDQDKEILQRSTLFIETELSLFINAYDDIIRQARAKLNRLNDVDDKVKNNKRHTLVFYKDIANRNLFFHQFLDKKEKFSCETESSYNNFNGYIKLNHQVIAINKVECIDFLRKTLVSDYLLITDFDHDNKGLQKRIHTIPFLVGCNFSKEKLPAILLEHCNIIEV